MAVRVVPGGVRVAVRVRPRSLPGWEMVGEDLVLGVAAAPVGGAATEEARRSLANALGVAPSQVTLHGGARSRAKAFAVAGVDAEAARGALERAAGYHPGAGDSGLGA